MSEIIAYNGKKFRVVGSTPAKSETEPKKSKYGNRKVKVGVIWFDSKREADRYLELLKQEASGTIHDLKLQPKFVLAPSVKIEGEARKRPAMRYRADFGYVVTATRARAVEDVKSAPTAAKADFRMRQHLMKSVHGIDVRIVK